MTPIDEELWFDSEGNDEENEAKAAESVAAMVGRILGAKPFPVAAQRLAELTRAPNARIDQPVRILESDPALSARAPPEPLPSVTPPKENNTALRGSGQRCEPHRLVYACVSTTPPQLAVVHELAQAEPRRVGSAAVA